MRPRSVVACCALAFAAGLGAADAVLPARGQGLSALSARVVNLAAMTDEEIGPLVPNTDLRSRTLVATEHGTVAIQSGNVFKHFHADANEVQYVIEGTGAFWLGDKETTIRPGDLIVIPKGTPHAGSRASEGRFKVVAIKLPPQRPDDVQRFP